MDNFNKENKYIRAKERVDELKKFYGNLGSYVVVVTFLALVNYLTIGFGYMWFLWVAFGWGIGVFFHALKTFNLNPFFGRKWEEQKIKQLMEEEESKNKWR